VKGRDQGQEEEEEEEEEVPALVRRRLETTCLSERSFPECLTERGSS
jgi:hypothetical protein